MCPQGRVRVRNCIAALGLHLELGLVLVRVRVRVGRMIFV